MSEYEAVRYRILDPTGNITALVEDAVAVTEQPQVAARIMACHPEVEQVGFVRAVADGSVQTELRMAGGEFCGNATMSAAALHLFRQDETAGVAGEPCAAPAVVWVRASGAADPVEVQLTRTAANAFDAAVCMPRVRDVRAVCLSFGARQESLSVVTMEGIAHIVIPSASGYFLLRDDHEAAGEAVRVWCAQLATDGLGLMFLEGEPPSYALTPLVYIPGSGTLFWENSCASGSAATGVYLATQAGGPVDVTLAEPGGCLRVRSAGLEGETWLYGSVRIRG